METEVFVDGGGTLPDDRHWWLFEGIVIDC